MKVLVELEDEDGEALDALAVEQDRSRTAQAKRLLTKAIREAASIPSEEIAQ